MLFFLLTISDEQYHSRIQFIYETYHNDMLRFAKSRCKSLGLSNCGEDAEDAVQNAFVKLIKHIDTLRWDIDERGLKAYVMTVVANEVANIRKDYRYYDDIEEHGELMEDEDFIRRLHIRECYDEIIQVIEKLDERYSLVLFYYYRNEMSVKEIAEFMGLPVKTVYTRLSRGQRILMERIGGEQHGDF